MKNLTNTQLTRMAKIVGVLAVGLGFVLPLIKENGILFSLTILIIVASAIFVSLVIHQNFFAKE